jgi:hypothetical protein
MLFPKIHNDDIESYLDILFNNEMIKKSNQRSKIPLY